MFIASTLLLLIPSPQTSTRQLVSPTPSEAEAIRLGGGVPRGFMILGDSPTPPPGYTASGATILASTGIPPCSRAPDLPAPRMNASAVAANGKLYVIGGRSWQGVGFGTLTTTVNEFDPSTSVWIVKQTPMPTPRIGHAAAEVNGRIFVIGGRTGPSNDEITASVVEYDPVTDQWIDRSPMMTPREEHGIAVVQDTIYVFGGTTFVDGYVTLASVEAYDTILDAWQARAPMLFAQNKFGTALLNGKIYAIGVGTQEYDPITDFWLLKTEQGTLGPAVSVNGRICQIVGSTLRVYDPLLNTSADIAQLTSVRGLAAVAALDNLVYVVGGGGSAFSGSSSSVSTVDAFDLSAWQTLYVHKKN